MSEMIEKTNSDTWKCEKCGCENTGKFCGECGSPRKVEKKPSGIGMKVLACVGACALIFGGGFLGGLTAGTIQKTDQDLAQKVDALEERVSSLESQDSLLNGFGSFFGGEMPEQKGSPFETPKENQQIVNGAGLGITVQEQGDDVVITGFAQNSNAEKAGLQIGDVIEKIDGQDADRYEKMRNILSQKNPGDTVSITVERNDQEMTFQVELVELGKN